MMNKEFYDVFLCYLASDSYDPEALRELLEGDPSFSAMFRNNLKMMGTSESWPVAAARKDLHYGFKDTDVLRTWLYTLERYLFGDGPMPE